MDETSSTKVRDTRFAGESNSSSLSLSVIYEVELSFLISKITEITLATNMFTAARKYVDAA
jgi:hypothetical protein